MPIPMDISVVIPLLDEQDSLGELHEWIAKTMQSNGFSYELIFIDDGSRDQSWEIIFWDRISKTIEASASNFYITLY